jgi:hypothetical protein
MLESKASHVLVRSDTDDANFQTRNIMYDYCGDEKQRPKQKIKQNQIVSAKLECLKANFSISASRYIACDRSQLPHYS